MNDGHMSLSRFLVVTIYLVHEKSMSIFSLGQVLFKYLTFFAFKNNPPPSVTWKAKSFIKIYLYIIYVKILSIWLIRQYILQYNQSDQIDRIGLRVCFWGFFGVRIGEGMTMTETVWGRGRVKFTGVVERVGHRLIGIL